MSTWRVDGPTVFAHACKLVTFLQVRQLQNVTARNEPAGYACQK
jgi:hypothetical protein